MTNTKTENSALASNLGYKYQLIFALEKCYELNEDESVLIEYDGDVSKITSNKESEQCEIKHYKKDDKLTDSHKNFWNTLCNWLDRNFEQEKYKYLILYTTQYYGENSELKNWNEFDVQKRNSFLENYINKEGNKNVLKKKLKERISSTQKETLNEILGKIIINAESEEINSKIENIKKKYLHGIPDINTQTYIYSLIGFILSKLNKDGWVITQKEFKTKSEQLTAKYCLSVASFPTFLDCEATDDEVKYHEEKLFVQKIKEIDYEKRIPKAIGSWLEMINAVNNMLSHNPSFKNDIDSCKKQLIEGFEERYEYEQYDFKDNDDVIKKSKKFYIAITNTKPIKIELEHVNPPPQTFKNGLIHDFMNDKELNLKWKIEID